MKTYIHKGWKETFKELLNPTIYFEEVREDFKVEEDASLFAYIFFPLLKYPLMMMFFPSALVISLFMIITFPFALRIKTSHKHN